MQKKINKYVINKFKLYLVFWIFLVAAFSTVIYMQIKKESGLKAELEILTRQKDEALALQADYKRQIALKASDKAIEDYAHSRLGLVYLNEIIIYDDNYKDER